MKKAIFGLGCFWGPEEKFFKLDGITNTEVGYCGGKIDQTTYEEVCGGETNHAEVVKIEFDEKIISYEELLKKFFEIHDPTTLNRQGLDVGTQYRSEIFFFDNEQKKIAEEIKSNLNKKYNGKIATNISKQKNYCKAEEYHQKYIQKKGL
ncbi:MAG TPA: peptide-methionine (S)-S-oxide reductase MsrA [Candidatus Pelagibacter bacterium]|jgi:methionine-S-sulfoxide reductase|nr:peptide-methionine (S)-S-oxide reductase [Flavobacteriaceae bacterium]HJN83908.1 peptide-methionine (S)-S-oxide reductase MsrA [Candidatus Pelagibacter bacterium]|tara:strand:+ start:1377 stop:1826 length:450 start_codon:yes stop_codon:yes gene_type:complete